MGPLGVSRRVLQPATLQVYMRTIESVCDTRARVQTTFENSPAAQGRTNAQEVFLPGANIAALQPMQNRACSIFFAVFCCHIKLPVCLCYLDIFCILPSMHATAVVVPSSVAVIMSTIYSEHRSHRIRVCFLVPTTNERNNTRPEQNGWLLHACSSRKSTQSHARRWIFPEL